MISREYKDKPQPVIISSDWIVMICMLYIIGTPGNALPISSDDFEMILKRIWTLKASEIFR